MIRVIHKKVPGRARFKVQGLYRSGRIKGLLERRLGVNAFILDVRANSSTGNLLICYARETSFQVIQDLILSTLSDAIDEDHPKSLPESTQKAFPNRNPTSLSKRISGPVIRLKDKIQEFLSPEAQPDAPWHILPREQVMLTLGSTSGKGLSLKMVTERQSCYGPNILPEPKKRSPWDILKDQFLSLPVALLSIAAGVSILTGGVLDALVIAGVVAANGLIGYATESEAERTITSLKRIARPVAAVTREGRRLEIPADQLVVGDIVTLKPGSYVPADGRMLESSNLSIDESVLTGESMPVFKTSRPLKTLNLPLADRTNMVYRGTLATGGEGRLVVVATGGFTEMGKLQALLSETTAPKTPIERQLETIGDQLVVMCLCVCGLVFFMGFIRGYGFVQMLRMAVSLAAAAVPEGLPAAATVNFALGIKNMRKHHVLIRHLQAVETLGSVQIVCFDKTGTITRNRMEVTRIYSGVKRFDVRLGRFFQGNGPVDPLADPGLFRLLLVCCLCNEVDIEEAETRGRPGLRGTPTEKALVQAALEAGLDVKQLRKDHRLLKLWNRSERNLYMGTLHARSDLKGALYTVKGSPSEVLSMCTEVFHNGNKTPLTEELRLQIETENERMAGEALRILGTAFAEIPKTPAGRPEQGLTWLGLIGMQDSVREGAAELISMYHRAGIRTVMITGDQSPTAYAVAKELNIQHGEHPVIMDSTELIIIDLQVMSALAKEVDVYSRVSPAHKLRIVQALQSAGRVVAMTGDGINDGPALKAADIGIAMGESGTDVAREVADVVLEDDNLESLIIAVRDGRATHSNIRKSVHFFLSTNLSEIMIMFASIGLGIGFPLSVMQLLWINLISDIFPGLALSMEAPERDVLEEKPRDPCAPLLSGADYRRMAFESGTITAGAMGAYAYGISRYGIGPAATTLAFQGLTLGQLLHAFSCRSEHGTVLDSGRQAPNRVFDVAVGGSILLQILTMLLPGLRRFLGVTPVALVDALVIGGCSMVPLIVNEATKSSREAVP